MYCSNCGKYNPDDAEFCQNCGQKLALTEQSEENLLPAQPVPAFTNAYPSRYYSILIKFASSKLFLAGIILFGISILIGIVSDTAAVSVPLEEIIKRLPKFLRFGAPRLTGASGVSLMSLLNLQIQPALPDLPNWANGVMSVSTKIGGVTGMIPSILIFAGMLMTYTAAVKSGKNGAFIRTDGLSLIKGVQIYMLVVTCLIAALVLLMLVLTLILIPVIGSAVTGTDIFPVTAGKIPKYFLIAVIIAAAVCVIGTFVFQIVFQAKVIGILSKLKNFAAGGAPYIKPSMFVIVLGFIGAGSQLLSAIGMFLIAVLGVCGLFPAPGMLLSASFAFVSGIAGGTAGILLTAVLYRYRKEMIRAQAARSSCPAAV